MIAGVKLVTTGNKNRENQQITHGFPRISLTMQIVADTATLSDRPLSGRDTARYDIKEKRKNVAHCQRAVAADWTGFPTATAQTVWCIRCTGPGDQQKYCFMISLLQHFPEIGYGYRVIQWMIHQSMFSAHRKHCC
jgi:hypothetical protein